MEGVFLYTGSIIVIILIMIVVMLHFIRKFKVKKVRDKVKSLEIERNVVASTPVLLELSKVEPIIKNDKMEEKYNKWHERFMNIKENKLTLIDDMLIDLDVFIDKRDYKTCRYRIAKIEIEIYKAREAAKRLLEEIKDITLSEEKYRSIVIKLKTKYRTLNKEYMDHKALYDEVQDAIELQLENIERRFLDFEKVMEANDYNEVVHIVKALDAMIEHMEIIVNEVPDVLLMAKQIIPNRMKEIKSIYDDMVNHGYPLEYLNIEYNFEESEKNIGLVLDKVKVLNLEGCMFDLKIMLEYFDSLFIDFEKERLSRKVYEEVSKDFDRKIKKTNKLVSDVYEQLDDIKNMYDLNEDDFDKALKSLGNMYDDEVRAREQLEEIQTFLKQCKMKMRCYKLPVITDDYFVQLSEANEAINEVIYELEQKPIVIKTLNTRVDTARDLVLKLYNTTNDMIKTAQLAEMSIVYGNRYRAYYDDIDRSLLDAEIQFFKGNYKKAFDIALKSISFVDEEFKNKISLSYEE